MNRVVAVLMEAKLTSHKNFNYALGQVCSNSCDWRGVSFPSPLQLLGYYVKFASDEGDPPLCAVVSEQSMQFLCFPYTQSEAPHPVVDCVVCPKIPLFHGTERKSIEVNMTPTHLACSALQWFEKEHCEVAKQEMKEKKDKLGLWKRAVTTAEGTWQTRGWHSKSATFTIRNYLRTWSSPVLPPSLPKGQ